MITIIAGANRANSNTKKVAHIYLSLLHKLSVPAQLLALDEVQVFERTPAFEQMENSFLIPIQKFIIVIPEYNGSYPGILKLMVDNSDVKLAWANKKALLVGVATGRAGNLRGMEHFTGALMHIKTTVHPNRLPLSSIHHLLDADGQITDANTLAVIETQLNEFIKF